MMLPILLVEDEEPSEEYFNRLLRRVSLSLNIKLDNHYARDYHEAIGRVTRGTYPLAIVDLRLPTPYAGADQDLGKYLGMEVVKLARKHNEDTIVAAYTAYVKEVPAAFLTIHTDEVLSKTEPEDILVKKLSKLVDEAAGRFNYNINVRVDEVLERAFGGTCPLRGVKDQWEVCLHRILRTAKDEDELVYASVGRGHSGAGVVAAYINGRIPKILKFDLFDNLRNEVRRHDEFVKDYIPKHAFTNVDELVGAGKVGIMSCSFLGLEKKVSTFAEAIKDAENYPLEQIVDAISDHFDTNCRRWFDQSIITKPYSLSSKCCEHLKPYPENIRMVNSFNEANLAVETASEYLQDSGSSELTDTIICAVKAQRREVYCRPQAVIHGDLNVNNLIWEKGKFWMIDFAETGRGPRLLDFAKLEASVKFDISDESTLDEDMVSATLAVEDALLSELNPDAYQICDGSSIGLRRKVRVIEAIRSCAGKQCGDEPEIEYWLSLFFVTAKHVEYLLRDIAEGKERQSSLVHSLVSAYRLAKILETTVI